MEGHNYTKVPNREIVSYWSKLIDECDLNVDWSEAHKTIKLFHHFSVKLFNRKYSPNRY